MATYTTLSHPSSKLCPTLSKYLRNRFLLAKGSNTETKAAPSSAIWTDATTKSYRSETLPLFNHQKTQTQLQNETWHKSPMKLLNTQKSLSTCWICKKCLLFCLLFVNTYFSYLLSHHIYFLYHLN